MLNKVRIFVEDNIMQKNEPATAGSKILSGFVSPINAAVLEKLAVVGGSVTGRLLMNEFALDCIFTESDEPTPAIIETKNDENVCVLANDVFGQKKRQAAKHGLFYLEPPYGTVSRYGLIATAASFDRIGVLCAKPENGLAVLAAISGSDKRDGAMRADADSVSDALKAIASMTDSTANASDCPANNLRLWFPANIWEEANDASVISVMAAKYEISTAPFEYLDVCHQTLFILAAAELCGNTNRFDGVKFGHRSQNAQHLRDLYYNTRSEGFSRDTKLAILLGAYVLSADNYQSYYEKAMKIRRLIKESITFDDYDMIVLPSESEKSKYEQLALYAPAALSGLPSVTVPANSTFCRNYNSGLQIIGKSWDESWLQIIERR
jgi:aspartyl-tRNA(Asn)/glutamyl-tRNA(Gln) amidotransferase subunit A